VKKGVSMKTLPELAISLDALADNARRLKERCDAASIEVATGDVLEFRLSYAALARAAASPYVHCIYIGA